MWATTIAVIFLSRWDISLSAWNTGSKYSFWAKKSYGIFISELTHGLLSSGARDVKVRNCLLNSQIRLQIVLYIFFFGWAIYNFPGNRTPQSRYLNAKCKMWRVECLIPRGLGECFLEVTFDLCPKRGG